MLFKSLGDAHYNLFSAFLVAQELLSLWPHIVSFICADGERQDFHSVQRRVSFDTSISRVQLDVSFLFCWCFRGQCLMWRWRLTNSLKVVWNSSKWSHRTIAKHSNGLSSLNVNWDSSSVGIYRCWTSCTIYYAAAYSVAACLRRKIGKHCVILTSHHFIFWIYIRSWRKQSSEQKLCEWPCRKLMWSERKENFRNLSIPLLDLSWIKLSIHLSIVIKLTLVMCQGSWRNNWLFNQILWLDCRALTTQLCVFRYICRPLRVTLVSSRASA